MQRQILAIYLLITGLGLGLLGNIFFYNQSLGLSVPLFVSIFIGVTIFWASVNKISLSLRKIWLLVPILFFAVMFAIRAAPNILLLNGLAIVSLLSLFIYYLNHEQQIDNSSTPEHIAAAIDTSVHALTDAGKEIGHSWKWLNSRQWGNMTFLISIGRGLLIALPIVIVFAILFSSADAVFAEQLGNFINLFAFKNFETFGMQALVVVIITWLSTGLLSHTLSRRTLTILDDESEQESASNDSLLKQRPSAFRLNITEATIILGSVVTLFAFFVFIQLTYFFGGDYAIAEGLTYSEYARRGFFELLAVSVITLALMLALDYVTTRRSLVQHTVFRFLSAMMVGLTFVIMASAWQRMLLYEEVYGFTYLRVYPHVFMVWLGILLAIGFVHLFRLKTNLFALGLLLVAIGYLGTLNLMNVDYYIAERNIERYQNGEELDVDYLRTLSVDALPAILQLTSDSEVCKDFGYWFGLRHRDEVERREDSTIFELNLAHDSAWDILESMNFNASTITSCDYYRD